MFDLTGRVAIVTGGNGGLGLAMALGLAAAGATVVIAARKREKGDAALASLRAHGADCMFVEVDVASAESCRRTAGAVIDRFGRVDILVNNAGINIRKLPQDISEQEWEHVLDINLTGAFRCAQAVYEHMRDQGRGKIINIGSIYSLFGAPMMAAYAASKGGVVQLTRALAAAWADSNIQVNAILPGWVDTELTQAARRQVEGLHDAVLVRTPAKRWGLPEDLAGVAVFLAAPASDFVTGAIIPVDGGYSIRG